MMPLPVHESEVPAESARLDRATLWLSDWLFALVAWVSALTVLCLIASILFAAFLIFNGALINIPAYGYPVVVVLLAIALMFISVVALLPSGLIAAFAIVLRNEEGFLYKYICRAAIILFASLVSTYLYDYAVPGFRLYSDDSPDWVHGITFARYLCALAAHSVIFFAGNQLLRAVERRDARISN